MEQSKYPWPNDFPIDVPPENAVDTDGEAFRLVKNTPPTAQDFVGHNQEPHKKKTKNLKAADYGTSMNKTLAGIKKAKKIYHAQRKKKIAKGTLKPIHGKMYSPNKTGHFEAWLRLQTGIEHEFKIVSA